MRIITSESPNDALAQGLVFMNSFGQISDSRNGPVIRAPMPVITISKYPERRVLAGMARDANPFLHLMESVWMLAGCNDVATPALFASNFHKYSDDGITLHGAYGHRWRQWFGFDQLQSIAEELRADPTTRRAVLSMWDSHHDRERALSGGKDVPCNTHIYFDTLNDGRLNMTVCCRSNDMLWGAYGANIVHFSFLLEWMAWASGLPMGVMRQFSNDMHLYKDALQNKDMVLDRMAEQVRLDDLYVAYGVGWSADTPNALKGSVFPTYIWTSKEEQPSTFLADCESFMANLDHAEDLTYDTMFFNTTVVPMLATWRAWKAKEYAEANRRAMGIGGSDWREAAKIWLGIREHNRNKKESV